MSCKDCLSENVCRYNDGHNEWCKGNCPRFQSKILTCILPHCENCGCVIYDLSIMSYHNFNRHLITVASQITPHCCPNCQMIIDRIEVDIENRTCMVRGQNTEIDK